MIPTPTTDLVRGRAFASVSSLVYRTRWGKIDNELSPALDDAMAKLRVEQAVANRELFEANTLADDVEFRRQVAEKVGTSFEVPAYEAIAMRPKRF
jgi:hypothetical protein